MLHIVTIIDVYANQYKKIYVKQIKFKIPYVQYNHLNVCLNQIQVTLIDQ